MSAKAGQRKKRILFIGPCDGGGISELNRHVQQVIARAGCFDCRAVNTTPWREFSRVLGYPVLYGLTAWSLARWRPDLTYLQLSQTGFGHQSLFLLLGKLAGCRTVAHFHAKPVVSKTLSRQAMRRLLLSQRYVDDLIVLAESSRQDLQRHGWRQRLHVLPNFVDPTPYPLVPAPLERRAYLLYLGRMERGKGIYRVLEIARHLPEERFVFVGPFPTVRAEADFLKHAAGHPNVQWLGSRYGQEKIHCLQQAKALIFPSDTEVFPMVLIEAALSGVAPFATNVGLVGSIIEHGVNGFLINADAPKETARMVSALVRDPPQHAAISRACIHRARLNFTDSAVGPSLLAILDAPA